MMIHLTPENNLRVIRNIEASGARFAMLTTFLRARKDNTKEYTLAKGHDINLLVYPYCLRDPLRLYLDHRDDMYMGVWELDGGSLRRPQSECIPPPS